MKKFLYLLLICISCNSFAQEIVEFVFQPTGQFLTSDGKEYVVIPFEEKSASELYAMVKNNVMSYYNSPKEVISEGENVITIYALEKNMWLVKSMGAKAIYGGNYKLVFRFKDGRVRVDAPSIDEKLSMTDGLFTNTIGIPDNVYLSKAAKKACSEPKKENKQRVEEVVNEPINYLLGISKKTKEDTTDDDW